MRACRFLHRPFASLWLGQTVSQLGDALIEVTLPIWVGMLTNNPTHVALVAATEVLPTLLFAPLAGACADRWPPRTTMIVCDLLGGLLLGSLLLVPSSIRLPSLYVVSCALAIVGSFFRPARNVMIRLVVEEHELVRAQALLRTTQAITLLLGPVLGSTLLFFFGPAVGLLADACSFGIGAMALLVIPGEHPLRPPLHPSLDVAWQALWSDMQQGFRFTLQDRLLPLLIGVSSVTALVGHLWYSVDIFFVQSSLQVPEASVGLFWTVSGAGGLLASLLVLWLFKGLRSETVLLMGLLLRGASLGCYALMTSAAWALPAAFFAGVGEDLLLVALVSLLMQRPTPDVLGRVTAFSDTASALMTVLALVTVGVLSSWLFPWQLLLLCGLLLCLVGLGAALFLRGSRSLPRS